MGELVNVIGLPLLNIGDLQNLKLAVQERKRIVPSRRCRIQLADELGYAPRRDEVFIKTRTRKNGDNLSQAAPIIKQLVEEAENHPDWKEKSIQEGDLYARVCGMKEPRGRVHVLGMGPTPTDLGTPGTQVRMTTRVLVEIEAR